MDVEAGASRYVLTVFLYVTAVAFYCVSGNLLKLRPPDSA